MLIVSGYVMYMHMFALVILGDDEETKFFPRYPMMRSAYPSANILRRAFARRGEDAPLHQLLRVYPAAYILKI